MSGGERQEIRFEGAGVSPGMACGKIHVVRDDLDDVSRYRIAPSQIPDEIGRFETALIQTRMQILEMQQRIAESIGAKDAAIFDAHLLVVEDRTLIDEVLRKLETDLCNVEWVFQEVATRYAETLNKIDDPYLRERALDIQDVTKRVIRNLQGKAPKTFLALSELHILVAHNLTPSDTASMNRANVLGIATDLGSRTSHAAILARSLNIPAVVGLHDITAKLETGQHVLVDGSDGLLIVNPAPETIAHYAELESRRARVVSQLKQLRTTRSTTRDGRHIVLSANIELPEDVEAVAANGAEGIGLYRTEFLYLNRTTLPTEDEQFETYRKVAERVRPDPLIIRTFDLGGDKLAPGTVDITDELNPFLGWRAIRLCLENIDIFKTQLRAILRASAVGNIKIMFPMISGLEELRGAKAVLAECHEELRRSGVPLDEEIEVGAMIEIPSAALCANVLASEVDFFSIGTNDLIQYTLAVDRVNEKIAHLYEPTHPAILRLLRMIAEAAHAHHIWVGVCGEMAGDVALVPLLLGLGMDELSAGATSVPRVKRAVQSLAIPECRELVEETLKLNTSSEILSRCLELADKRYGDLLG
ncbi:MAG: phosphoenolpyruvate--protein phosphotransferase [Verrucomicrobia bacterium]|nr:MAG: phosphoenolpyruvate--protein phosphotransferase [Verrucomicrobia bacterium 13_2_20CM_54_12]OLB43495.1 MAG: phosphoenolpyruvate--protein phosphotransferase [Verrucomicrobia bacterium 13_2_20CM_2_54_15]OLD73636.1 MAG: phosphoenolpyruvate--protein phosphotransferase [Verrucomicrobia bacterium 13_1_20CM_54_28]OLD88827.1 MAG: phosphoenolpyruvate--protein phosphotransferase [Verrucomicrobia bacterium 13_1_20CM_4_54_11]OLE11326.1 MAG: phosphoenolpyruvate--protein phosphotransferase [Verrucomic